MTSYVIRVPSDSHWRECGISEAVLKFGKLPAIGETIRQDGYECRERFNGEVVERTTITSDELLNELHSIHYSIRKIWGFRRVPQAEEGVLDAINLLMARVSRLGFTCEDF